MNPEVKPAESINDASPVEEVKVQVNNDTIASFSTDAETNEQWRQIGERVSAFLSDLPDYIGAFFSQYKRPLTVIGLFFGAVISVKLLLAILDSINDIPLLAPTFELIGIGYSAWFVYRYLWQASNRKELADSFNTFKNRVLGSTGVDL
ncbi:CAAD domain-containing protein [Microcoleus sp. FACHB-1515]|uniref:CAAD domain-containing protein n=1 Tax=Cyanophyceae TaxID=3028117 RepID=UPI0016881849|nr:CAAD domain-containing protein [Microcoleus sp. FACHB-1515]MBD2090007.1 CAAD domain-containing protein [Microcoleus sp. FACHB-1515]